VTESEALRVGARVTAHDGDAGKVDAFIVDPVARAVTHLVLNDEGASPRRLAPMAVVIAVGPDSVEVDATREELRALPSFDEPDYKTPEEPSQFGDLELDPGFYFLEPYATPVDGWLLADHERIPPDEVAIRRGSEVAAVDGTSVGRVDEFLVDPTDGQVTHVVVRSGHLFNKRDIVVPVRQAGRFADDRIQLELTVDELDALPKMGVRRHRHVTGPG
jgi:hypothetical protein